MSLLIVLPSENALLATRRLDDKADKKPITHALDSDVFYYLCRYTDWVSGIIGKHSALSYARIAAALTEDIPRKPSRSLRTVNRNDVRNSVKRLRRIGVLSSESITDEKQNQLILRRVFWQQLLTAPDCQTNPDTRQLSGFIAELSQYKSLNNSDLEENSTANSYATDATYNNTINITNRAEPKFRMSLTWQYDENLVELFLQAAGFSSKQIKQVWFGKYVQYWSGESIQRTQREWSLHFANHMQGYLLRPDFFEKVNGMLEDNQPSTGRNRRDKACLVSTATVTTVPRLNDGEQLQTWALAQGLPAAPVGLNTTQYYQLLCNAVERQQVGKDYQKKNKHRQKDVRSMKPIKLTMD